MLFDILSHKEHEVCREYMKNRIRVKIYNSILSETQKIKRDAEIKERVLRAVKESEGEMKNEQARSYICKAVGGQKRQHQH